MTRGINLEPLQGKETNPYQVHGVIGTANVASRDLLAITIENKNVLVVIDPETDVDPDLVGMVNFANTAKIPSCIFAGSNMIATSTTLFRNQDFSSASVFPSVFLVREKIWVDWLKHVQMYHKVTEPQTYTYPNSDGTLATKTCQVVWNDTYTEGFSRVEHWSIVKNSTDMTEFIFNAEASTEKESYVNPTAEYITDDETLKATLVELFDNIEEKTGAEIEIFGTLKADYVTALMSYFGYVISEEE